MTDETYYWLSFRDPDQNLNLGICIVKAPDMDEALRLSHRLKINPGGEVAAAPMTQQQVYNEGLQTHRLYSRSELVDMGYLSQRDSEQTRS